MEYGHSIRNRIPADFSSEFQSIPSVFPSETVGIRWRNPLVSDQTTAIRSDRNRLFLQFLVESTITDQAR
jgi:hypothetical protein